MTHREHGKPHDRRATSGPSNEQLAELIAQACQAREKAYAPYSRFLVGAALETKSGMCFTGCNIENASFGATICAERVAAGAAIAAGHRAWKRLVVATRGGLTPCGICRQFLVEFEPALEIILYDVESRRTTPFPLDGALPGAFRLKAT